jgi:transcriptional regulator with XRE-family HTH domain
MPQEREALRCGGCGLVQYMTESQQCRRCGEPLTLIKYLDLKLPLWRVERMTKVVETLSASVDKRGKRHFARELGQRLKTLRKARGLKRADLGKVMDSPSLCRVEGGQYYPSINKLEKYADVFKITVHEILAGNAREKTGNELLDDELVAEVGLHLRQLSWERWVQIIVTMKNLGMRITPESLRVRADLEREYCQ